MTTLTDLAHGFGLAAGGIAAALLIYALSRLFSKNRSSEWSVMGIELPPRRWPLFIAALLLVAAATAGLLQYIKHTVNERKIPPTDPTRFSVLVTDFTNDVGENGAATQIARVLQSTFGRGVQVLRVPFQMPSQEYGDVGKHQTREAFASAKCAARYNGDVVIWGQYHPNSNVVELSYSIKGDRCLIPTCGAYVAASPSSTFSLNDIGRENSAIRESLVAATVQGAINPLVVIQQTRNANRCFDDLKQVRLYESKAARLVESLPKDISEKNAVGLLLADGVYHMHEHRITKRPAAIQTALKRFEEIRSIYPASKNATSGLYGAALVETISPETKLPDRRRIADRIEALEAPANDPDTALELASAQGQAWNLVFELSNQVEDFQRTKRSYEHAREVSEDDLRSFEIDLGLTEMNLGDLKDSSSGLIAAKQRLNDAQKIYAKWPAERRNNLDLSTRFEYFRLRLSVAEKSRDAKELSSVIKAVVSEHLFAKDYWNNSEYIALMRQEARTYYTYARVTGNGRVLGLARNNMRYLILHVSDPRELAISHDVLGAIDELFYIGFGVTRLKQEAVNEYKLASNAYRTIGNNAAADRLAAHAKSIEKYTGRSASSRSTRR